MKNIYESFLRWLTLWLSEDSRMYFHLTESSYESLDGEFWAAIAPEQYPSSPWDLHSFEKRYREITQRSIFFGYYSAPVNVSNLDFEY